MVRNYKPRNRIYRNSKLSEDQVVEVLTFCLMTMPTKVISGVTGISGNSIRKLEKAYIDKLVQSYSVRRCHFEKLFEFGAISERIYFFIVNNFLEQNQNLFNKLDNCIFHCPNFIQKEFRPDVLENLFEIYDKKFSLPKTDSISFFEIYGFLIDKKTTVRKSCPECNFIRQGPLPPERIKGFYNHISHYYRERRLKKENVKRYYLFLYISYISYFVATKACGINWPESRDRPHPEYRTAQNYLDDLLPAYYDATNAIISACVPALIEDPL